MNVDLPKFAKELFKPYRLKVLYGGRGCVHGETLLDTPKGKIKMSEFLGGDIFSLKDEKTIVTNASRPMRYTKEVLYRVELSNGNFIICTDEHKFFDGKEWVMLKHLSKNAPIVCGYFLLSFFSHPLKYFSFYLSKWLLSALHCLRTLLNYLDDYSGDCHQYDERPLSYPINGQASLPLPSDATEQFLNVSCSLDDREILHRHNPHPDTFPLSNRLFLPSSEERSYVDQGSRIVDIFFGLFLELLLKYQLFLSCSIRLKRNVALYLISPCLCILYYLAQTLQTVFGKLSFSFPDNSCFKSPDLMTYRTSPTITKIKSIDKWGVDYYWDLHVPETNCYFANGVLNHNSGKSMSVARVLCIIAAQKKTKILCGREFQNSINDSVHSLLKSQIEAMGLTNKFIITANMITGKNGSEFLFKGVHSNIESIKSIPDIDILWLEEADKVSKASWDVLTPTIRKAGSEIWVTYNPQNETDPTHVKFVNTLTPPDDAYIRLVNWKDNPFFPEVLRKEKDFMYRTNPDLALHVWEGQCRTHSDAQIFKDKWEFREFEVESHFDGPYLGSDWGFSSDPTTLVQVYLDMEKRNIMIRRAVGGVGIEMDDIPALFDQIKGSRERKIRGDCSRPETISYVARQGFNIEAAKKWSGSVEDGIEWIKSFNKVIIHTDCPDVRDEFKNYSFKVDRLTGDVTCTIIDAWNHYIDSLRYALEPLISAGSLGILDVL